MKPSRGRFIGACTSVPDRCRLHLAAQRGQPLEYFIDALRVEVEMDIQWLGMARELTGGRLRRAVRRSADSTHISSCLTERGLYFIAASLASADSSRGAGGERGAHRRPLPLLYHALGLARARQESLAGVRGGPTISKGPAECETAISICLGWNRLTFADTNPGTLFADVHPIITSCSVFPVARATQRVSRAGGPGLTTSARA